jgi:DUF4097 and DUF4098 domain-containing protein YvlB
MLKPVLWALSILALSVVLISGFGVFTIPGVLADGARGTFDRTLSVGDSAEVQIKTGSGSIRVHSGTGRSVIIHGEIHANRPDADAKVREIQQNPPVEQSGNTIRIGQRPLGDLFNNVSISYDVTVPPNTRVEAHSGSGSVKVTDLKAPVKAHAGSGSIEISNAAVEVEAGTGSGTIHLTDISGRLNARTGSGSINVSGDPTQDWTLHTGSGSVHVRVPPSAGFNLRAHTGSGSIKVEQGFSEQFESGRHNVEGKVRGGGPLMEASTGSGSIQIGTGSGGAL